MARPKKQTVDYFPHYCTHGKTMYVLEQRFGNNGYAFWFKILELLGTSIGHFIDCRNNAQWEFLQSKTHLNEDACNEILNLLAKLDAIDLQLWQEFRVIWVENFVKGISDVFKNRRVEIPLKPNFLKSSFYEPKPPIEEVSTSQNPPEPSFYEPKPPTEEVSTLKSAQSKLNKTKKKELNKKEKEFIPKLIPERERDNIKIEIKKIQVAIERNKEAIKHIKNDDKKKGIIGVIKEYKKRLQELEGKIWQKNT